jgi:hypothetical protein
LPISEACQRDQLAENNEGETKAAFSVPTLVALFAIKNPTEVGTLNTRRQPELNLPNLIP